MRNKSQRASTRCRWASLCAAAMPVIGGGLVAMIAAPASAAITFKVTDEGVPQDNLGHTAVGWTAFLITLIADPGQQITAIDLGNTTSSTQGIFGSLLQSWTPPATPTPAKTGQTGSDYGLDSHVLLPASNRADATAPFEDSNLTNPSSGVPANDASHLYGTGTYLHGEFGIAPQQLDAQPAMYVVVQNNNIPTTTFKMAVAEPGGVFQLNSSFPFEPHLLPIISLAPASIPLVGYGNKLTNGTGVDKASYIPNIPVTNAINVHNSGPNAPGYALSINSGAGQPLFYVEADGFSPGDGSQVYALDLAHGVGGADTTPAEEATIAGEINATRDQSGVSYKAYDFAAAPGDLQAEFPTSDLFLVTSGAPTGPMDLGVSLVGENQVGGIVVVNISVVPEPSTTACGALAAVSLLGRRGKSKQPKQRG